MLKKIALILVPALIFIIGLIFVPKLGAAGNNLIANPSAETPNGSLPANWTSGKTGTNTTVFNYLSTGHTGNHSLQVQMTKRNSGQAYWVSSSVNITPNTKYTFSDWYQSNVQTTVAFTITKTGGGTSNITVTEPASSTWKQATTSFTSPARAMNLTVRQYINRIGQVTTDDYDLEGPVAPTAPTVNLTAPLANAVVTGTQTISASASDAIGMKNVQFKLDGVNLGTIDTTSPYSVSWDTKKSVNGTHSLTAVATNTSGLTTTSSPVTVDVENLIAPTVQIIAPSTNSIVSGTQAITASTSSAQGVASVQFKLNGANLGSALTTAPYTMNWDTTKTANGAYNLTAVVTDKTNLADTSATVSVTVSNQAATPPPTNNGPNLVANPSLETSTNGTSPDSWLSSNWGTNTSAFTYLSTGHTGSRSIEVQTTSYTNGAANWYYNDLPVTAGQAYQYTNWYKSNVDTEVDAEVTMTDGTVQYYWLGAVLNNPNWTKFTTTFTPPAGAKSMAIYQILAKVGYIISDDYSINTYTPLAFNRALVSVTFDDGWANQYQNAFPLLTQHGLPATFYIISGELADQPDYMSGVQVQNLKTAGHEIGSHTVTHPDLTTLSAAQMQQEMSQSQATLQSLLGVPVTDFAYPYGAYNASTIVTGKLYYQSQRTVNAGFNTKDNFDLAQLKIEEVDSNISQAQVQGWINAAIAQKSWLILVYHEIAVTPTDPTDALYDTQPADLNAELAYLKNSGVATVTVNQAINEILLQL